MNTHNVILFSALGIGLLLMSKKTMSFSQPVFKNSAEVVTYTKPIFDRVEKKYQIPLNILSKMAFKESGFRPDVVSGKVDGTSGEKGIMQITPKWHPNVNPLNVEEAIEYAGKWLKDLYNQFGDWSYAVMAYNWGPENVKKWIASGMKWASVPQITQAYVEDVLHS